MPARKNNAATTPQPPATTRKGRVPPASRSAKPLVTPNPAPVTVSAKVPRDLVITGLRQAKRIAADMKKEIAADPAMKGSRDPYVRGMRDALGTVMSRLDQALDEQRT